MINIKRWYHKDCTLGRLSLWAVASAPLVLFVLKTSGSVKLTEEERVEFGWVK